MVLRERNDQQLCESDQLPHHVSVNGVLADAVRLPAANVSQRNTTRVNRSGEQRRRMPLPAMAQHKDGPPFTVATVEGDNVLIQKTAYKARSSATERVVYASVVRRMGLLTKRRLLPSFTGTFDISWVIPAIVRCRTFIAAGFILPAAVSSVLPNHLVSVWRNRTETGETNSGTKIFAFQLRAKL